MSETLITVICLSLLLALIVAMHGAERAERRRLTAETVVDLMQRAEYERRADRLGLLGSETNRRRPTATDRV